MVSMYIICFTVGLLIFLTIFLGNYDIDNPGFIICIAGCFILALFGCVLYPTTNYFSYKDIDVKIFEYHKFSGSIIIFADNKVWSYKDIGLFNTISGDTPIKLRTNYNFFKNELNKSLIINNKEY